MTTRGSRPARWPVALLAGAALAGCSSGSSGGSDLSLPTVSQSASASVTATTTPSPTPTPSAATASASPSVEGASLVEVRGTAPTRQPDLQVHQDYVAFWQTDMAALARSDPAYPPLLARLTGQQRSDTVRLLTANRAADQTVVGGISIQPQVLAVTSAAATVADCVDLSGTQVQAADGTVVAGSRGTAKNSYVTTMRLVGGRWQVANIDVQATVSCG